MKRQRGKEAVDEDLDLWIDRFLHHLAVEKGLSRNTLEAYARDLQGFAARVRRRGISKVGGITAEHTLDYFQALRSKGLSARSTARTLSALRGFHKFLLQERAMGDNPLAAASFAQSRAPASVRAFGRRGGGTASATQPGKSPGSPRPGHAGAHVRGRSSGFGIDSSLGERREPGSRICPRPGKRIEGADRSPGKGRLPGLENLPRRAPASFRLPFLRSRPLSREERERHDPPGVSGRS